MFIRTACFLVATLAFAACETAAAPSQRRPPRQDRPPQQNRPPRQDRPGRQGRAPVAPRDPTNNPDAVPLTDLADTNGTYKGFEGGLYFGSNEVPAAHAAFGAEAARNIQPLDTNGAPSPNGAIVLMSISMSNAAREWCRALIGGTSGARGCEPQTFMGQAANDPAINDDLVIVNGARPRAALSLWDNPDDEDYTRVATEVLPDFGLTEAQVQIVWVKTALRRESTRPSLPDPGSDAYVLEATIGDVVRALRARYPNLQQVFFTSRIYGGYARLTQNSPEPWAYETGFGTKWAIEAQVTQRATGAVDRETGDLAGMPFMAWGPYIWSYGNRPREDGLMWRQDLFRSDWMHPNEEGARIVADYLLDFFKTAPFTRCWFLNGLTCS